MTGGTINTSTGLYTAPSTPGTYYVTITQVGTTRTFGSVVTVTGTNTGGTTPTVTDFSLSPSSVTMAAGSTRQFTTSTTWSDGASRNVTVSYQASGGTVSSSGVYTAGQVAGTFGIIAVCSCGLADTSAINVTAVAAPQLVSLDISPKTVTLAPGGSQSFGASARWSTGATTLPPISFSTNGGTVNSSTGAYIAPATPGTYRVIVAHTGGTVRDTALVTVQAAAAPVLTELTITPGSLTLSTGGIASFATSARWSNGGTSLPPISYSTTGGSITSGGVYTAPGTAGTYRVIVAHSGGTLRDTATVTVQASSPPPPPPSTGGFATNVPSGLRLWFDTDMDNLAQKEYPSPEGLRWYGYGNDEQRATDGSTPFSDAVHRVSYPGGSLGGGTGVGSLQNEGGNFRRMYVTAMVKLVGSNGQPYRIHYNEEKWLFPVTVHEDGSVAGSGVDFAWILDSRGNWATHFDAGLGAPRTTQNYPVYPINDGRWNKIEHYMQMNTPGQRDGVWRMWVNGVLAAEYTNCEFSKTNDQAGFKGIRFITVRGGSDDAQPTPAGGQFRLMDRLAVYVSEAVR